MISTASLDDPWTSTHKWPQWNYPMTAIGFVIKRRSFTHRAIATLKMETPMASIRSWIIQILLEGHLVITCDRVSISRELQLDSKHAAALFQICARAKRKVRR